MKPVQEYVAGQWDSFIGPMHRPQCLGAWEGRVARKVGCEGTVDTAYCLWHQVQSWAAAQQAVSSMAAQRTWQRVDVKPTCNQLTSTSSCTKLFRALNVAKSSLVTLPTTGPE